MTSPKTLKNYLLRMFLIILAMPVFLGLICLRPAQARAAGATLPLELQGQAGDKEVTLNWNDPNDQSDLAGYRIIYSRKPCLSFEPPNYLGLLNTEVTSEQTIGGLDDDTHYFFEIARVESGGVISGESNIIVLEPQDLNPPITNLTTDPNIPQGLAGWFTVTPNIYLRADETAVTFYQWNLVSDDGWQKYSQALVAPEGESTLYYYSVDAEGNTENVKWQVFKVDTIAPPAPGLSGTLSQGNSALLSWTETDDVSNFEVWQILPTSVLIAQVPGDQLSYLVGNLSAQTGYQFEIVAYDLAGNKTDSNIISMEVPAPQVVTTVSSPVSLSSPSSVAVISSPRKITPAIGEGISIVAQAPTPTPQAIETPQKVKGAQTTSQGNSRTGWNRLLIALSVLIIAAAVAVGGYYGYEWMNSKPDQRKDRPKKDSRW
jgi:hypothetical protein